MQSFATNAVGFAIEGIIKDYKMSTLYRNEYNEQAKFTNNSFMLIEKLVES